MTVPAQAASIEPIPTPSQNTSSSWKARLELGFAPRGSRTALTHRLQRGPLAVQRPFYPEDDLCHIYLLHPPGGVVGGDQLDIEVKVEPEGHALITNPGATKFYASAGHTALQNQRIDVASGASLEWLPQENIFFPGAICQLKTDIQLTADSRFIGWDIQCLGRPVNQERFDIGRLDIALNLSIEHHPKLMERLRISEPEAINNPANLRGLPVNATLLATPADKDLLAALRQNLQPVKQGVTGLTLLDNLLVARYLGESTEEARNHFIDIWKQIRPTVIERSPCPPRIWAT